MCLKISLKAISFMFDLKKHFGSPNLHRFDLICYSLIVFSRCRISMNDKIKGRICTNFVVECAFVKLNLKEMAFKVGDRSLIMLQISIQSS